MKTSLEIINKIESKKVELGMNVELATLKDITEAIGILKNIESTATKLADSYEAKMADASKSYQALLKERNAVYTWVNNEIPSRLSEFEKAAKELGLDINQSKEVIELKKLQNLGKEVVKALDAYKEPKVY